MEILIFDIRGNLIEDRKLKQVVETNTQESIDAENFGEEQNNNIK